MSVPQTKKKEQSKQRDTSAATATSYAEGTAALEFAANYGLIQEALNSLDQGLAIYDSELRLVVWNRRFLDLLDYPTEMAHPGTELSEFIRVNAARGDYGPGDIDDLVRQRLEIVRRKKKHWSFERARPNGMVVDIRHNALPDGGLVSTYIDITARKKDEEALRRQAVVMEQLNEAVIVSNLDPVITECNEAAARIFGCRREDLIGLPPISMMADANAWKEDRGDVAKNLEAGSEWAGEVEMRRRGGLTFLAELVMAPSFDHHGQRSGAIAIIRDITEKKKAEEALRHQAVVMEQLNEAVIVMDLERRITLCNLAAENMFGYGRDFLLEETVDLLVADLEAWRAQQDEVMQLVLNGDSWTGETKYRRKDGTVLIGELTLAPLLDPDGEAISLVGVIRDITERKAAEDAIRESEDKYRTLFETIQDGIVVTDLDGRIERVNPGFADMVGYSAEELKHLTARDLTPERWQSLTRQVVDQVMSRGFSDEFEKEYLRSDGTTFPASVKSWHVFDKNDEPVNRLTIIRDITEKKSEEEANNRQMAIIEETSDLVAMTNCEGQILYLNRAGREMLGIESDADIKNYNLLDFHPKPSKGSIVKEGLPAVARDGIWRGETEFMGPDGRRISTSQLILAHKGSDGEIEYYSTIARDMTERSESMAELRREKEKAEIANRAKTEFLANMSHELRTPLNAIIGFSKMMQDRLFGDLGAPQYEEYATSIHDSGAHLLGIINDILDLSKIEAGKFELDEYPIEIGAVVEWCLNTVKPRAQEARQKLTADLPDCLPSLMGDERVVRQVILNLLSNSVKFTPEEGSIDIRVTHNDDGLAITVSDTGIGIPKDKLEHVFDPFGQADGTLSRQYGGTGLGLSITKSLVEMHDGTIDLQSEVDVGTSVTLRFPSHRLERQDPSAS